MLTVPHTVVPGSPILLLGEAPGQTEVELGAPFVGASGQLLNHFLKIAGIDRSACSLANVFNTQPPNNDLTAFCGSDFPSNYMPPLDKGKYVQPPYLDNLDTLSETIAAVSPNLIVGLGNTACWALLHKTGIAKLRGFTGQSKLGVKFLATYHPAAVLRNHKLFPTVAEDFIKAKRQSTFPELIRPRRTICIASTVSEARAFWRNHGGTPYSCDVETANNQITCVGFAAKPDFALVIPFVDLTRPGGNYWSTPHEELLAWLFVQEILQTGTAVFHNGTYDLSYLLYRHKIQIKAELADTMVLHHAVEPEIQKSLSHLGSIFTDEPAWKLMRLGGDEKREDK